LLSAAFRAGPFAQVGPKWDAHNSFQVSSRPTLFFSIDLVL
jgi:hypothetical protein